jgi:hypothetical protein
MEFVFGQIFIYIFVTEATSFVIDTIWRKP